MKIQISPNRIVKDAITVWNEHGPEVDVVMDLTNLTFKEGSADAIYSFHVLDHLFMAEGDKALKNWTKILKPGSEIFVVVDDFEYLARAYVGGDMPIKEINGQFSHPSSYDRYNLSEAFQAAGYLDNDMRIWHADVTDLFPKKHYELVMAATKR